MAKILTKQEFEIATERALAHYHGYEDGENYQMSEPREPRFEDYFDCDEDPYEPPEYGEGRHPTIEDIAILKAHNYAHEYNPSTGKATMKSNYAELKEAYKAGFLEGFTHRLTEPTIESEEL